MFLFVCHSVSSPKVGLLFVILSVIFMKGGVVRESEFKKKNTKNTYKISVISFLFVQFLSTDVIWNTLKKLRVDPGSV